MFRIVWFPAFITFIGGYLFMSVAPLSTQFMSLFGVGYAGLSIFLSGLLWSHSFVQLPSGLLLDRLGTYRGFLIATSIIFVSCLLPFIDVTNITLATFARFIGGLSSGALFLAGVKIAAQLAPPDKLATVQGIQGGSFCLGTLLPFWTLPYLGNTAWKFSYLIPIALAILGILLSFLLPKNIRQPREVNTINSFHLLNALKQVMTSPPIWVLGVFHGLSYGTLNNIGQWLPSILADFDATSHAIAWGGITGFILLIGTLSRSCGSSLTRYISQHRIITFTILSLGALYIALGLIGNIYIAIAVGFALAICGGANYGSIFALTGLCASPMYLATAAGFMNMIANITNVLMTLLLGMIREYTGHFSVALISIGVLALVVFLLGRRIIYAINASQ